MKENEKIEKLFKSPLTKITILGASNTLSIFRYVRRVLSSGDVQDE